ncbi:unnamed protein product [Closterium sp. Yama58-4]|nr:unnamed protein product [Closterium sp. Yama58-4]
MVASAVASNPRICAGAVSGGRNSRRRVHVANYAARHFAEQRVGRQMPRWQRTLVLLPPRRLLYPPRQANLPPRSRFSSSRRPRGRQRPVPQSAVVRQQKQRDRRGEADPMGIVVAGGRRGESRHVAASANAGGDPGIKIHIHLPAGGWCFNAKECLNRSLTFLGSSDGWPPVIPDSVPMGGILNDDPDVNPLFADWPLARINYCDGGGFAGQRGRINVTVPSAPVGGAQGGGKAGRQGRVLAGMKPGPGGSGGAVGGGGSGSTGGAVGGKPGGSVGGKQRMVPLYMDGWSIVRSIIDDLKTKRGFAQATEVLLSGSSAGGQATIYLCDRVAAAFPSASTRCVADSGYFVNSIDRNGTRLWERLAKSISSTQQLSNPACRKRLPPSRHWACFFPEQALMALKTPIFVIQSLFDVVAAAIGGQTRTTPDHNFYNYTATIQCQAAGNTPAGIQKQQADDEDRRRRPAGEGREDVTLRGRMRGPGGMRAADREFRVLPLTVKAMAVASAYRVGDSSFVVMGEYLTPVLAHHLKRALVDECAWEGESGDRAVTAAEFLWLRKEDYHGKPWAPVMIRCTFARPVGSDNNGGSLLLRRRGTEEPRAIVKKFPLVLQEVEMEVLREEPGAFELIKRPPLYELAHCSGPLYGHLRPRAVSDWLHYHSHAVGVQHFFLHDFGAISGDYAATSEETAAPSAEKLAPAGGGAEASAASGVSGARAADTREEEPSLAEVVAPFKARGLVTVTRLLGHERFRSHYWHQILTQNDCLYRARFTARWLIFTDMDEYIFTPPPASLSSALAALARSSHAWASMGAYWGFITRCRVKNAPDILSRAGPDTPDAPHALVAEIHNEPRTVWFLTLVYGVLRRGVSIDSGSNRGSCM